VRQEIIDAIDATEPYEGGKGHALWQLHELNQPDKHEFLILAGPLFSGVDVSGDFQNTFREMGVGSEIPEIFLVPTDKLFPLKVGDELYIEPLDKEMVENRRFAIDVSISAPAIVECEPAIKTLRDMTNLVDNVITTLGRFLP